MSWRRKNNPRPASRRALITQTLKLFPDFVHPELLYLHLRNQQIRIGFGTIYATLNQLTIEGLVLKRQSEDRRYQYRIKEGD